MIANANAVSKAKPSPNLRTNFMHARANHLFTRPFKAAKLDELDSFKSYMIAICLISL